MIGGEGFEDVLSYGVNALFAVDTSILISLRWVMVAVDDVFVVVSFSLFDTVFVAFMSFLLGFQRDIDRVVH